MCSLPLTVSGGVSMAKTSPRGLVRSNVYYARFLPAARPLLLQALKRGLGGHEAGLARVARTAGTGIGAHVGSLAHRPGQPGGTAVYRVSALDEIGDSLHQRLGQMFRRPPWTSQ
jgi:hypothetical protein